MDVININKQKMLDIKHKFHLHTNKYIYCGSLKKTD